MWISECICKKWIFFFVHSIVCCSQPDEWKNTQLVHMQRATSKDWKLWFAWVHLRAVITIFKWRMILRQFENVRKKKQTHFRVIRPNSMLHCERSTNGWLNTDTFFRHFSLLIIGYYNLLLIDSVSPPQTRRQYKYGQGVHKMKLVLPTEMNHTHKSNQTTSNRVKYWISAVENA